MNTTLVDRGAATLLRLGMVLFLLGLLTGFLLPAMANPRMGLSSHLEGVLNGIFLLVLGLAWGRLALGDRMRRVAIGLAAFGTYTNWAATLAAGFVGAGATMMPIAGGGHVGLPVQELLIGVALMSLSVAMIGVSAIVLWGLRRRPDPVRGHVIADGGLEPARG